MNRTDELFSAMLAMGMVDTCADCNTIVPVFSGGHPDLASWQKRGICAACANRVAASDDLTTDEGIKLTVWVAWTVDRLKDAAKHTHGNQRAEIDRRIAAWQNAMLYNPDDALAAMNELSFWSRVGFRSERALSATSEMLLAAMVAERRAQDSDRAARLRRVV